MASNHKRCVTAGGQVLRKKQLFRDDRIKLASLTVAHFRTQSSAKLSGNDKSKHENSTSNLHCLECLDAF